MAEEERILEVTPDFDGKRIDLGNDLMLRGVLFLNIPTVDVASVAYGLEFRRPCIVIRTCHRIAI